ncbi:MAG: BTAD domain-containing putative transcriptional regulator [Hyphomicrobiaceae bacterium]
MRDRLADLLWTDHARDQGRANLRQTLTRIRRAFHPLKNILPTDKHSVSVSPSLLVTDAFEFSALARSDQSTDWATLLDLYSGELLAGLNVDAPAYDEWLLVERQSFADHARSIALKLLDSKLEERDQEGAISAARRVLALDPYHEHTHRNLMTLLTESGRRSAALSHFDRLQQSLLDEIGVEPQPLTFELRDRIAEGGANVLAHPTGSMKSALERAIKELRDAADRAASRGEHAEAELLLDGTMAVINHATSEFAGKKIALHWSLCQGHLASGRFDEAMNNLEEIIVLADSTKDSDWLSRALSEKAQLLRLSGCLNESTQTARRAVAAARGCADLLIGIQANLRLATIQFATGEYRRALASLLASYETIVNQPDAAFKSEELSELTVRNYSWLTWTCAELGRYQEAEFYGTQGLKVADANARIYGRVHARTALGILHLRSQNFAASVHSLQEAQGLVKESDLRLFDDFIVPALACALAEQDQIDAARALFLEFRPNTESSIVLSAMADANRLIDRSDLAAQQARRAVSLARAAGFKGDRGWAHRSLGLALFAAGPVDDARQELKEAEAIAMNLGMMSLQDYIIRDLRVVQSELR